MVYTVDNTLIKTIITGENLLHNNLSPSDFMPKTNMHVVHIVTPCYLCTHTMTVSVLLYDLVTVSLRSVLVTIQCVFVPTGLYYITAPLQFI